MPKLDVFDPAMCCSTGVCGPAVDPVMPRFAADLDWLKRKGVTVERLNLAQQPGIFAKNDIVKQALSENGTACLPLVLVDGRIVSRGAYPSRDQLAAFVGLTRPGQESLYSAAIGELVAIGASIASNSRSCFDYHYGKARELGLSDEDISRAVRTALGVKEASEQDMLGAAERRLGSRLTTDGKEGAPVKDPGAAPKMRMVLPMASSESLCCRSADCC